MSRYEHGIAKQALVSAYDNYCGSCGREYKKNRLYSKVFCFCYSWSATTFSRLFIPDIARCLKQFSRKQNFKRCNMRGTFKTKSESETIGSVFSSWLHSEKRENKFIDD